ncbi:hypothetical protein V6R21_23870 [Limibacter armeniacum]|uniref:hypothetical protein n=1 Tax=Limibacter armeniacum TaxID=466084 RepID=UPI002FE6585A
MKKIVFAVNILVTLLSACATDTPLLSQEELENKLGGKTIVNKNVSESASYLPITTNGFWMYSVEGNFLTSTSLKMQSTGQKVLIGDYEYDELESSVLGAAYHRSEDGKHYGINFLLLPGTTGSNQQPVLMLDEKLDIGDSWSVTPDSTSAQYYSYEFSIEDKGLLKSVKDSYYDKVIQVKVKSIIHTSSNGDLEAGVENLFFAKGVGLISVEKDYSEAGTGMIQLIDNNILSGSF